MRHNGFVNANTALADRRASDSADATEVVVAGTSAGSASAALYGGLSADLPSLTAAITVIADASGAYPERSPP